MIDSPGQSQPKRIAIVGTGISSLTCAYHLHAAHDLTIFEADDRVGGHTHTVDVMLDGRQWAVDTGFIVFNPINYPKFSRMLDELGVDSQPSNMSFSVRCDQTGVEYNGGSINQMFARRRNALRPAFYRMIRDVLRFQRQSDDILERLDDTVSVEQFVREYGYSTEFLERFLIPMGAALWSCPPATFRQFPIRFVVEFFENHRMLTRERPTWRVVRGGSRNYVDPLIRPFADRIRCSTPVKRIERTARGIRLYTNDAEPEAFDHVIVGCHADQALRMLDTPSSTEQALLTAFPYQANDVVLHTDNRVLPKRRRAWASWNYHLAQDASAPATVTYNMNMLQGLDAPETFCVTLNETQAIAPERICGQWTYDHPIYTPDRSMAQSRHAELIDHDCISYCGAYWGFGFHEDGVASGLRVCERFGVAS
ncbi:MAG: FAD-dependent oxidoreductase [Planctomycetota bacterium]